MAKEYTQQEILIDAMLHAKKAFERKTHRAGLKDLFDMDMTGYCYDKRGNMTYKISFEAQDGIEDYADEEDEDGKDVHN